MARIGDLIRDARLAAGLTQLELAERAGTSQPALTRYERGAVLPTLPTLERVLSACGRRLLISAATASGPPTRGISVRSQLGGRATALRRRRARVLEVARARGVRKVRAFGSLARDQEHPGSDIDLLIELEPGRTLLDLAAFRREVQTILGVPIDVATPDMLKERIRAEVLSEALPL